MSKEHSIGVSSKNPDGRRTGTFFLLLAAGVVIAVLGLFALTGWVIWRPLLSSFGANLIPMAPATAALFIFYGLAVCCRALAPLSVRTFQISVAVGCFAGLAALLLLVLSCFNIHYSFEHFGLNVAGSVDGIQIGHMSPVTSFCFLLASVSFLASLPLSVFRRWRVNLALGSASVLLGICFVFLLPYIFGSPLLYGGTFIPPAFSTILAFTMLGLALVFLDRRERCFSDGSPAVNSITLFHFIMIFLFLATSILLVGNTYYRHIAKNYSNEVGRNLSAVAELKVGELVQWRKERLMDGSIIFKNPSFSILVRRFFENPEDEDVQCQLLVWLGKYPACGIYDQIRLLDAKGVSRLVLPAGQEAPCSVIVRDASEVQRTGRLFIQDFYRNDEDQRIYLALMIPVLDESDMDHPLGVLVMRIDPMTYLYPFIQHWPTNSPSAETLLLRRDGDGVLFLNDLRHRANTALNVHFPLDRTEVPAVKVALGQTGIMSGVDYSGVPVLSAAEAVPDSPWFLVAKMDDAEIQEPLREQFWQILVLIGVMLFSAGTGVTLLWRQQHVQVLGEKAKTTELLLASELQYRRLFEAARDGILILDAETGMVVDVNPFLIELLGVSRDVFLGRNIWELGFFKDIVANRAKFAELQQKGYVRYEDMALEGGDGRRHEVEFVSNVYLVNQKKVVQCNIRDITERKELEAENLRIQGQNRQLQKSESLGRMSGAIAHNFNNQLQVVQGYLEMVIRDLPPGDSHAVDLAKSLQASQKASEVSANLLAYLGQKQVKLKSLELAELCRMSLPGIEVGKPENVILETDLPSPGPCISADAKQIQQILTNLVINAWEAIGDIPGVVHLGVRTVSSNDIPSSHRFPIAWQSRDQQYACMEVTDSGCGIAEKDMENLFDPFFSTKFTGRGLGLSVVLGIVKTHDAVITVENRIGGGSVFSVFFPLSNQIPLRQPGQIAETSKFVAGDTVLLVEDEPALREMTRLALVHFGFTVLQARDGVEAVEIFGRHKDEISCVMSDLTMPRMDGWETITALRAIRHDLPVILASGYDEATVMAGEHSELPDVFLNKPYDINKLSDMIGRAIVRQTAKT